MRYACLSLILFSFITGHAQSVEEKENILNLAFRFFKALEKQDTSALNEMYVPGGRNYAVYEVSDSIRIRYQDPSQIRFTSGQIIRERMRKETTTVQIKGNIAMAWVPYDLWVNETFSHCGVDVFTLIRTGDGWKIATIAYTMEKTGCD